MKQSWVNDEVLFRIPVHAACASDLLFLFEAGPYSQPGQISQPDTAYPLLAPGYQSMGGLPKPLPMHPPTQPYSAPPQQYQQVPNLVVTCWCNDRQDVLELCNCLLLQEWLYKVV